MNNKTVHRNVLIVPQTLSSHFGMDFESRNFGIVDIHSDTRYPALHRRGQRTIENIENLDKYSSLPEDYEYLKGKYFYGGIFSPHFGHFFSESIHRLRGYIENQKDYDGLIFLASPFRGRFDWIEDLPTYIQFTLRDYFGVELRKIKWILNETVVSELTVFSQDSSLGNEPDKIYLDYLRGYSQRYLENNSEKKNYILSRSSYLNMGRCLGLDYIFGSLNSFKVFRPEEHDIETQIRTLINANLLVIEEGSAIHLIDLIGYTNAKIVFISRRGRNGKYWQKMYESRCKEFLFCDDVNQISDSAIGGPGVSPSVLSLDSIKQLLYSVNDSYKYELDRGLYRKACFNDLKSIIKSKNISDKNAAVIYAKFENIFEIMN